MKFYKANPRAFWLLGCFYPNHMSWEYIGVDETTVDNEFTFYCIRDKSNYPEDFNENKLDLNKQVFHLKDETTRKEIIEEISGAEISAEEFMEKLYKIKNNS